MPNLFFFFFDMHRLQKTFYSTKSILPNRTIKSILENETSNSNVSITGWIRSVRKQKQLSFATVNDGSSLKGIQAILNNEDAQS
jgi:asparaginyl-tRNA synthetase